MAIEPFGNHDVDRRSAPGEAVAKPVAGRLFGESAAGQVRRGPSQRVAPRPHSDYQVPVVGRSMCRAPALDEL
ncbi:hypothetical protein ASD37_17320 [Mycobacterium sp. Root135]|nr:hypothetical protein ASD37_17320 [Mycobacterium sp. Root135]